MKLHVLWLLFFSWFASSNIYAQRPLEFVQNKGQWGSWFEYKTSTPGGDVCLEKDGFRYVLGDPDNNYKVDFYHHGQTKVKPILKFHVYKVTFEGANIPELKGEKPQKVYYNYFLGNDSSKWKSGIHPVLSVDYNKLYNGIDMHVTSAKGNIEYEFMVSPNADASQIKLKFEGQDRLKVKNQNLIVSTSVGDVTETKPYAYQYINYERVDVPCEYSVNGNEITYEFPSGYDHSQLLIIDPTVALCTLTGSTADNWGYSATYDEDGNFYAGGLVNTLAFGGHFPVTPGAFQVTFGGGNTVVTPPPTSVYLAYAADISIIKYDPTLATRIYGTYLGGTDNEHVHSMIVDAAGNLIIAGRSASNNYPVTAGAYQTAYHGGWDIVVSKLNSAGTSLLASTYIGGTGIDGVNFDSTETGFGELKFNYGDDSRSEVQVDKSGNIYVTGCTSSTDFPTTPAAISTTLSGLQDGVVCKFNSTLSTLLWGTYLSGNGSDAGYVIAFDTAQSSIYVAGGTNSTNFPTTGGGLHTTFQGGRADGFILKFKNSAPYNLQAGTYVGTSNYDQIYGIQVSDDNFVYVMGQSLGGLFPVTAGVYSNAHSCQFAMKLDSNLTSDLISTVFGNGDADSTNISPVAFLVDTCGNVYISGWGGDLGLTSPIEATGTAVGMPVTSDAIRGSSPLGRDFYFIVLGPGMTTLRYATYYGRSCPGASQIWEGCHVDGGTSRFNKQGIISQAMCADCGGVYNAVTNLNGCMDPFPTTPGVWSMVDSSANCNEAALKIAFNIGPVSATVTASPSTSGCAPLTVNFTNTSNNGLTYLWDFGDGSPTTTTFDASHTFTEPGSYIVTLSAANSNSCFVTHDTARLIIIVDSNSIVPGFTYTLADSCGPFSASFVNTSISHVTGDTSSYNWFFGDGNSYSGTTPPTYTYADSGTYTVMLVMANLGACKTPDTVTQRLRFNPFLVSAKFTSPDSVCAGTPISVTNTGVNATSYSWTFGDSHSVTEEATTYTFGAAGTYTITLIAQNGGACNGADTFIRTISVLSVPTANFSYTPTTAQANIPTTYTNLSTNASRYLWDFGDNTTSNEVNPTHQYNKSGEYNTCLTAYNVDDCPAMLCKQVPADVEPLIGLPSGFSPNGDGENDILYVRGAAIKTLDLKIFNRWGQLVFETTSQEKGWDGTYNGQPQPIDAYAFVLQATFIDGTGKVMKGNITLLR